MQKIDQTIEKLLSDVKPVQSVTRPEKSFFIWGGITLAATVLIAFFSSLRPDLSQQLRDALFLTEVAALFCTIASTAIVAVWLGFPDLRQAKHIVWLPIAPLAVYVGCVVYRAFHPETETVLPEDAENGMNCVICITLYSLVPGFWMFRTLRRYASTRPALAGGLAMLASASIGLLILKFLEGNDSVLHLMEWHVIPVIVFGIIGALLGKKFLRW